MSYNVMIIKNYNFRFLLHQLFLLLIWIKMQTTIVFLVSFYFLKIFSIIIVYFLNLTTESSLLEAKLNIILKYFLYIVLQVKKLEMKIIKDLILIVDSPIFGNKIICRLPQQILAAAPENDKQQSLSQFFTKLLKKWDYFGMINQQSVALDLSEDVFVKFFSANIKYPGLTIQIDEQICVTRSVFFTSPVIIENRENQQPLTINSFNLIAIIQSYEHLQTIKHLICFLASVIEYEQIQKNSLSSQFVTIRKQKQKFVANVKEQINKINQLKNIEETENIQKIQQDFLKRIRQTSSQLMKPILIFKLFKYFLECVNLRKEFKWEDHYRINPAINWRGPINERNIMYKTLVHSKNKIKEKLGETLNKKLQNILNLISVTQSFQEMSLEKRICENVLKVSAEALIQNNLAILIHPIQSNKFITSFKKKLPIQQFENIYKLKPGAGLALIKFFETYRSINELKEIRDLKDTKQMKQSKLIRDMQVILFLLLNGIIKQVQIYIYDKKVPINNASQIIQYNRLKQYSFSGKSIHEIARYEQMQVNYILTFLNKHRNSLGFYYVE